MTLMDCSEVCELLHALEDDELPSGERAAVVLHLQGCARCATALGELQSLRGRIRASGTFAAPAALVAATRDAIGLERRRHSATGWRTFAALAASHVGVAVLAALAIYWLTTRADDEAAAARDVVAAHVRSLLADWPVQVASADTHTVRPWFAGKVPFAPEVVDLAARGFPLQGARVDYVLGRVAAALVYERRRHRIDLFILPEDQAPPTGGFRLTRSGYNVVAWRSRGFAYFAASDVNLGDLQELAEALQKPSP